MAFNSHGIKMCRDVAVCLLCGKIPPKIKECGTWKRTYYRRSNLLPLCSLWEVLSTQKFRDLRLQSSMICEYKSTLLHFPLITAYLLSTKVKHLLGYLCRTTVEDWWFLTKLNIYLFYDPLILLLGIHLGNWTCMFIKRMFTGLGFMIDSKLKQHSRPVRGEQIHTLWHI